MNERKDFFWPLALGIGAVVIAGGAGLYLLRDDDAEPEPVVNVPQPAVERAPAERASAPPPPAAPRALPLPPLEQSDPEVLGGLTEIFGSQAIRQYLVSERIVRNIVVTIDNATRQQMALNQRPIQPTSAEFITAGPEDALVIAPENYARYAPFIALVRAMDAKTLVSLYRGLQPLFQQSYEQLGHPGAAFNGRLIEVIDHLLSTPNPQGQIRLVQPSVQYRYADERLEKLSAGQKLLIRMGPENAAVIKAKLREILAELA